MRLIITPRTKSKYPALALSGRDPPIHGSQSPLPWLSWIKGGTSDRGGLNSKVQRVKKVGRAGGPKVRISLALPEFASASPFVAAVGKATFGKGERS